MIRGMSDARRARIVRGLLRLFGAVDCLALPAVLMPRQSMEAVSAHLGFVGFTAGPLPE